MKVRLCEGHVVVVVVVVVAVFCRHPGLASLQRLQREKEREIERVEHTQLSHSIQSPHKHRGGLQGRGGLTAPHAPGKKRETETTETQTATGTWQDGDRDRDADTEDIALPELGSF